MTDHLRNEWVAEALADRDDRAEWEASRNEALGLERGWVSGTEMRAQWAADRAAVEAQSHRDHIREVAERAALHEGWREMHGEDAA